MNRENYSPVSLTSDNSQEMTERTFTPPSWYRDLPLWVQDPLLPGNAAHNYPLPIRIRGLLNRDALLGSLHEVMRRQEVLRSRFQIANGGVAQTIAPLQPLTIAEVDLTAVLAADREAAATPVLLEEARRPFDLKSGPMLRAALLRFGAEDHILLLTTHHVVCDDWSTGILLRELFTVYAAFAAGRPSPLPELTFQYADYVKWLEERLRGQALETRLQFWQERLGGGNDFHHIPGDHVRPERRTFRGAHERMVLPKELKKAVEALSRQERVTPYMALLAALQCLLRRYAGQEDIGVGSCVANRPLLELENLVGPCSNVVVLRTDLSGRPSYAEVLRRVREASLAAYSYQDLPFGTLLQHLQPTPAPDRNPLFQLLFVLLNAPSASLDVPGLTIRPFSLDTGTTRYELNLWVKMREGLELDLQYNSDLFAGPTIRKFLEDYRAVLESMCADPKARIPELPITKPSLMPTSASQRAHATPVPLPAANPIEAQLKTLWEEVLGRRNLGIHDDFFALGGDSLRAARIFARLQESLKVAVPLNALFQAPTIASLGRVIAEEMGAHRSSEYLVPIQPGNSRPALFCVHGHSGNLLMYRILAQHLGADQPVIGIQPRGLDGKQAPLTRAEDMAAAYLREVQAAQPVGPYFLAGYCMGGTVAFEMARQLTERGETVGLLALLDTYNWNKLGRPTPSSALSLRVQNTWLSLRHFFQMDSNKKLKALKQRFREFREGPIPPQRLAESNARAAMNYVPRRYLGQILHVCPTIKYPRYASTELAWDELAAGVEQFVVPGYPWQLFEEPQARLIASKLRACIDECSLSPAVAA